MLNPNIIALIVIAVLSLANLTLSVRLSIRTSMSLYSIKEVKSSLNALLNRLDFLEGVQSDRISSSTASHSKFRNDLLSTLGQLRSQIEIMSIQISAKLGESLDVPHYTITERLRDISEQAELTRAAIKNNFLLTGASEKLHAEAYSAASTVIEGIAQKFDTFNHFIDEYESAAADIKKSQTYFPVGLDQLQAINQALSPLTLKLSHRDDKSARISFSDPDGNEVISYVITAISSLPKKGRKAKDLNALTTLAIMEDKTISATDLVSLVLLGMGDQAARISALFPAELAPVVQLVPAEQQLDLQEN